jgi:hypothetical protein
MSESEYIERPGTPDYPPPGLSSSETGMYDDDISYTDNVYEVESTISSDSEGFSVVSHNKNKNKKKNKQNFKKVKKNDPGYRKIRKSGKNDSSLEYFVTSIIPGTVIRNAVSGSSEPIHLTHVGSVEHEHLYFKVSYKGNKCGSEDVLFYDNPEQFERHMKTNLNINLKRDWYNRYDQLKKQMVEESYNETNEQHIEIR